jgi:hypothetical protein
LDITGDLDVRKRCAIHAAREAQSATAGHRLGHDEAAERVNFTLNIIEISEIVLEAYPAHAGY